MTPSLNDFSLSSQKLQHQSVDDISSCANFTQDESPGQNPEKADCDGPASKSAW